MGQIFFVYLLTFANGKVYVGMSRTDKLGGTKNRYKQHTNTAKNGHVSPVYNAWRKHGAPVQSILSTHATRDEAALAEIDAIQARDSMNPERGYNLQPGGQGLHAPIGSAVYELMRVKVWNNPERRRKSSEALKGKPLPDSVLAAHKAWRGTPEAKAQFAEIANRPERNAKLSAIMHERHDAGFYAPHQQAQIGRGRVTSAEGHACGTAKHKARLATEEGKAASRKGMTNMRANPENEAKRLAALTAFLHSDSNKAHCMAMGAAARKPVKDLSTGQTYESRQAAARAFGVTGPTIGYWVRQGKFAYTADV